MICWQTRPEDFWADVQPNKAGAGWLVVFRLPWKPVPQFICQYGEPVVFKTKDDARCAAINFCCNAMAPHLHSAGVSTRANVKKKAEALFRPRSRATAKIESRA